jgi:hypothetical protein
MALLAAFALAMPASAKAVKFILLSGPRIGTTIKTNGGPTVPDRLNRGHTRGRLVPQSAGNQFTFKGRISPPGGAARRRGLFIVDEEGTPIYGVPGAVIKLSGAIDEQEQLLAPHPDEWISKLNKAKDYLKSCEVLVRHAFADGAISGEHRDRILKALMDAKQKDNEAIGHVHDALGSPYLSDRQSAAFRKAKVAIRAALGFKREAMGILVISDLLVAVPEPAAGFSLVDVAQGAANNIDDAGNVVGEDTSVSPAKGFVREADGDYVLVDSYTFGLPTNVTGIGPGGAFGGTEGSAAEVHCLGWNLADFDPYPYAPTPLREDCRIADGSEDGFFGDSQLASGRHVGTWFKPVGQRRASRGGAIRFRRITVGEYAGSSALFTANDRGLAFGDHFLRGSSGPFRAFRADLNKRGQPTTELYRPRGGSTQPIAATNAGLAGGAALLSNGKLEATFWWGGKHYTRFRGKGGAVVRGMNEAGVAVGTIDANGDPHAALFLGGVAYDLNDLNLTGAAGWELTRATDINNKGQIVGNGILGGVQHAFLLETSP